VFQCKELEARDVGSVTAAAGTVENGQVYHSSIDELQAQLQQQVADCRSSLILSFLCSCGL